MSVDVDLAELGDAEVYVGANLLLKTLAALPDEQIEFCVTGSTLAWSCGRARGALGLWSPDDDERLPPFDWQVRDFRFEVGDRFSDALMLGALACGSTALNTAGLYGVVLDNRGADLRAFASDNRTLSSARLRARLPDSADIATVHPEVIPLLAHIGARPYAALSFDQSRIFMSALHTRLVVHNRSPLRADLAAIVEERLRQITMTAPLNRETVKDLLKRAEPVSNTSGLDGTIAVDDGTVTLAVSEGEMFTTVYLLSNTPGIALPPIRVALRRFAKALPHVTEIGFGGDHVTLTDGQRFIFVVEGRSVPPEASDDDGHDAPPASPPEAPPRIRRRTRRRDNH
jgi:hypothetical protein